MTRAFRFPASLFATCTVLLLWACTEREDPLSPQPSLLAGVARVDLTPANDTLNALGGDVLQLTASAYDAGDNPVGATFTYESLDTARAYVNAAGLVSSNRVRGVARIVATAEGKSDTANIVIRQVVKTIGVTPERDTLDAIGATLQITTAPVDSNDVAVAGASQTWLSLDEEFATVDAAGLVTSVKVTPAVRPAGIRVRVAGPNVVVKYDTAAIVVRQVATTFLLTPQNDTLNAVGDTLQLTAVVTDANGTAIPVAWKSLKKNNASVDAQGRVWSLRPGIAQIQAFAGGVYDTAIVVTKQVAKSVEITPAAATLGVGDTLRLTAIVRDSNDVLMSDTKVAWLSLDTDVANVVPNGSTRATTTKLTAFAIGTARVRGLLAGIADTSTITVAAVADAASHTWAGTSGTDFANPSNWTPAYVPASSDTVVIAATANQPVLGANVPLGKLVVQNGATFALGTYVLTLTHNLRVVGDMTMSTGHAVLAGSATVQGNVSRLWVTGSYSATGTTIIKKSLDIHGGLLQTDGQLIEIRE